MFVSIFKPILICLLIVSAAVAETQDDLATTDWSEPSSGLQARLSLKRWKVTNGSGIIATYLELRNSRDLVNAMELKVTDGAISFRVTDKDGNEVPVAHGPYSGPVAPSEALVLPFDSELKYRIGPRGHGISGDMAAHLDLGVDHCWRLPKGEYYLTGVLKIDKAHVNNFQHHRSWHGRIELPPVLVPMESPVIDEEELGTLIKELGEKMLAKPGPESDKAFNRMSLVDDPRVVEWYVKAVAVERYDYKCRSLDRLGYFDGEQALRGIKIGLDTKPTDFADVSRVQVAKTLVNNVRHYAIGALAKSKHPKAQSMLLSLHHDESATIRLSVIQHAARIATADAIKIVSQHTTDKDEMVRTEAKRLLKAIQESED